MYAKGDRVRVVFPESGRRRWNEALDGQEVTIRDVLPRDRYVIQTDEPFGGFNRRHATVTGDELQAVDG